MDHKTAIASIKITKGKNTTNINIDMPIWTKRDSNGRFYANLALLGGITTFADNEIDLDIAINEAASCFFIAAQKNGKGIFEELKALGWMIKSDSSLRYKVRRDRPIEHGLQNISSYPKTKSLKVDVAA
jgi:hypothetical protein